MFSSVAVAHGGQTVCPASRAVQADEAFSPSPGISPHATAVAGTLASSGSNQFFFGSVNFGNWSKGAAYNARVNAYAFNSGLAGPFSEEAANNNLRLANNSYGHRAGWSFDGADWIWYGLAATNAPEDWKFGAYAGSSLTPGEASSVRRGRFAVSFVSHPLHSGAALSVAYLPTEAVCVSDSRS